ncbi:MAG: FliG C-terminal domain-containing protein [Candidatus Firestonebacteria bacterium]
MRYKYFKAIIALSLLSSNFLFSQTPATSTDISDIAILNFKVEYEKKLKENIEDILTKTLGQGKSIVNVSVDVTTDVEKRKKETYTKTEDDGDLNTWLSPGIPIPPGLKDRQKNVEVYEAVVRPKISRIDVVIILEKFIKDKDEDIKEIVEKVIGLPKAQQKVEIKRREFSANPLDSDFFDKNKIYLIVLMIVIAAMVFLFGPVRLFMKNISKTMSEGRGREANFEIGGAGGALTAGEGRVNPAALGMGNAATGASSQVIEGGGSRVTEVSGSTITLEKGGEIRVLTPFSFIKKSNIQNLIYLIQEEPPEIVSLIMTYLPQEEAVEVMAALPIELQAKVAIAMSQVKQASAESVLKAEEEIKRKIDFLVGGLERFMGILDRLDKPTRDEILESLEKESPALAEKVRREIFAFENIIDLEDAALQVVLREVKTDALAKVLTKAPPEIVEKVKKNISGGSATLLQEEMDLIGYLTPMQIDEERSKVVNIIKKLEKEGKVAIGKKRKKVEKIEKIQRLESEMQDERKQSSESLASGGEKANRAERKVSISDYEGKSTGKILSMVNIFKEMEKKKKEEPSVSEQKKEEKESLFVSKKAGETKPTKEDMAKFYNLGVTAYKGKRFDEAINEFNKCVALNPGLWQVYQFIGNCYYAKGNMVETVRAYQKSLSINSNNPSLASWIKAYYEKNKTATK